MSNHDKIDMSKELNIKQNLRKSKYVTSGSSFIGALLFFVAFVVMKNSWWLAASIILLFSGFAFIWAINAFERKYQKLIEEDADKK